MTDTAQLQYSILTVSEDFHRARKINRALNLKAVRTIGNYLAVLLTGWMPHLSLKQQHRSTEGMEHNNAVILRRKLIRPLSGTSSFYK